MNRNFDFEYAPVDHRHSDDDGRGRVVVVATFARAALDSLVLASGAAAGAVVFDSSPLFWYRLDFPAAVLRAEVAQRLEEAGHRVRYVASFFRGSERLGLALDESSPREAPRETSWKTRREPLADDRDGDALWFLRDGNGVDVSSAEDGRGTRLAVIDDDAGCAEELSLDAEILVGIDRAPRSHSHGPQMIAWAVGSLGARPLAGVAPAASPRLYVIPKPGTEVLSLALAVACAVRDGADVIVCATYVEGANSPMLADAFAFASRHGRGGLGTALVFPTGREASSPAHAVRASWSLSLADPASDPRVFCIAPGSRNGGWFRWKDRRGAFHPFGNRGPQVRWLAPGDDIVYPFGDRERTCHAESSGASAIAAGVLLCVLGANPALGVDELDEVVTRTAAAVTHDESAQLHPADAAPVGNDADGHNAKHGYGRMNAQAACAMVSCPVAGALVAIGEPVAAKRWLERRREEPSVTALYSPSLSRWLARAALADSGLSHALRTMVRHLRLIVDHPERSAAQVEGALLRHAVLVCEAALFSRAAPSPPLRVQRELERTRDLLLTAGRQHRGPRHTSAVAGFERTALSLAAQLFRRDDTEERASGRRLRPVASMRAAEVPDDSERGLEGGDGARKHG